MDSEIRKLDKLCSEYVRKRAIHLVGGCERCLTKKYDTTREDGSTKPAYLQLQCAHCFTRNRFSTRWLETNLAGICPGCHMFLDENHDEKMEWFKERLGPETYELLRIQSESHYSTDKELIRLYLENKIQEVDNATTRG